MRHGRSGIESSGGGWFVAFVAGMGRRRLAAEKALRMFGVENEVLKLLEVM